MLPISTTSTQSWCQPLMQGADDTVLSDKKPLSLHGCGRDSDGELVGVWCDPALPSWGSMVEDPENKSKCFSALCPRLSLLQNFLATSSCPEIQGYLYVKEVGRKSWKKVYMFLRRSGLYCSTKGTSKVTATRSSLFQEERAYFIVFFSNVILTFFLLCNYSHYLSLRSPYACYITFHSNDSVNIPDSS